MLNAVSPRVTFIGSSTRGPFTLVTGGVNIRVQAGSDLRVTRFASVTDEVGTVLVLDTDFTCNNTDQDAVTVSLTMAQAVLTSTQRLLVERIQVPDNTLSLSLGGDFSGPALAAAIDKQAEYLQELRRDVDRAIKASALDATPSAFPLKSNMSEGYVLGIDGSKNIVPIDPSTLVTAGGGGGGGGGDYVLPTNLVSWNALARATGLDAFAVTPSSANLKSLLTDETGTGSAVFAESPAFTGTPTLNGVAVTDVSDRTVKSFNINKFQTLKDRFATRIEPTAVGCLGDGSNINSALEDLEAWLAANPLETLEVNFPSGRLIEWHAGFYRIHKKLTFINGESMKGAGGGATALNFITPGNGGIELDSTGYAYEITTNVRDLRLVAGCQGAGKPLVIKHRPTLSTFWNRMNVHNIQADGKIFGDYWSDGMEFAEAWNSVFDNVHMVGQNDVDPTKWLTDAFKFSGATVSGIQTRGIKGWNTINGVNMTMTHLEGAAMYDTAIVSCRNGVLFESDTGGGPLHININTLHVAQHPNATATIPGKCLSIKDGKSINMQNTELYVDGAASGGRGIKIDTCAKVSIDSSNKVVNVGFSKPNSNAVGIDVINPYTIVIAGPEISFFKGTGDIPIKFSGSTAVSCEVNKPRFYQANAMSGVVAPGVALTTIGGALNTSGWNDGGVIQTPNQPAFLVRYTSSVGSVTGGAQTYPLVFPSEIFDVGGCISAGVFTYPTTAPSGQVLFDALVTLTDVASVHNFAYLLLITSNRQYVYSFNPAAMTHSPTATQFSARISALADMDPGDTAYLALYVEGETPPNKTVGILGHATNMNTYFSGWIVP